MVKKAKISKSKEVKKVGEIGEKKSSPSPKRLPNTQASGSHIVDATEEYEGKSIIFVGSSVRGRSRL